MTTPKAHWSTKLPGHACREAVAWAKTQPSYALAWSRCKRADWLLWLAGALCATDDEKTRKTIALAACKCARTALKFVPKGEMGPLVCIQTVEAWCRGKATIEQAREARRACAADAAYAAAADAYAYAAYAYAAGAAAAAAAAADAYAYAAGAAAADAAAAYAYAYAAGAAYAAADATRQKASAQMAPIVRTYVKRPALERISR